MDFSSFTRLALLLIWLSGSWPGSCALASQDSLAQVPLVLTTSTPFYQNFSVGFSLQSSYGAAAIIFTKPNGELETQTVVSHGGRPYREVMARLSLESSRHPAPPYGDDGEYWADQPRQAARTALKAIGLPASYEVGVLSAVVRSLRAQLEGAFGIRIAEAVFTASHLAALYQDDLEDVAVYLGGLRYVTPRREFHPYVWETSAAYAGYGRGLCGAWWNDTACALEEVEEMPVIALLSVHYGRTALTVALSEIDGAGGLWEPLYRHRENFGLGREALGGYGSEEEDWEDVRREVLIITVEFPGFPNPDLVMVTGDTADGEFLEHLRSALMGHIGSVPEVLSNGSLVAAAKGAVEFMRRGPARWSR
ncbi:hypothetical protein CONLIGDRAFT_673673 [Coniochaeta ligniaria NRRL 30616]|uniref:Uncharacterized protein n=1 Tax=Coniochaeta ligniaria NRRL 30616 TaxID=1408157 RepID=A0A1J7JAB8_9PEZI|nr:hypothetical protein CONLIGDRAFT_673673 [Coniochaeta ligniaria NRRL 30616]